MLRVLALNIWNLNTDWRSRRGAIVQVVKDCAPDVVCLQEVIDNKAGNQAQWLAMAYAGADYAGAGRFGNAILSARPIDDTGSVDLPHAAGPLEIQRSVLHARTDGVDVFCTHFAWQLHDASLRERQARALVDFVGERADHQAQIGPVIAGDFNSEPGSSAIRYLTGLGSLDGDSVYFQDAWRLAGDGGPGITWSNSNPHAALDQEPDRRLDYVLSRFHGSAGNGRPIECQVVADEPIDGVWPSDHFGVLAVLQR